MPLNLDLWCLSKYVSGLLKVSFNALDLIIIILRDCVYNPLPLFLSLDILKVLCTDLFCYLCAMSVMLYLVWPCILVVTCLERADLLALLCVVFSSVLSLSHMMPLVRCGIWLYWFQIFAFFLILIWLLNDLRSRTYCNTMFEKID